MTEVNPELVEIAQAATCRSNSDECMSAAVVAVLTMAYRKAREHASSYRGTRQFRRHMEAYREDRSDPLKARKALVHEFYARGIESAARDIADLLGVPEHDLMDSGSKSSERS